MVLVHSWLFVSDTAYKPNRGYGLWYPNPAASRLITISASAVIHSRPRPHRSLNSHPPPRPFPSPPSSVHTSIVISATLRLTLSPFILRVRSNGFLQIIPHRYSHRETVSAERFLSLSGVFFFPFPLLPRTNLRISNSYAPAPAAAQ